MPFEFTDAHIESYYHHGYTVFRGIVPPSLVADLRKALEPGRDIARELRGPSAQRLQPISRHADKLDLAPVKAYTELPELVDACQRVLSREHTHSGLDHIGVFYEPAELSYCTQWHRDITFDGPRSGSMATREAWDIVDRNPRFFTQVNFALYTDVSTWYVPGSNARPDLAGELAAADAYPQLDGEDEVVRERRCHTYASGMPGAVQLVLQPGDYALYQPNGWHIGNYTPYRKRMTLHEGWWTDETREWYAKWGERKAAMAEREEAAKQSEGKAVEQNA